MEEEEGDDKHRGAGGLQAVLQSAVQLPYNVAVGLADEIAFHTEGITPGKHAGNAETDSGQLYHESPSQMHQSYQHDSDEPIDLASSQLTHTAASASSIKAAQHDHAAEDERTTLAVNDPQAAEQRPGGSPKKCVTIQDVADNIGEESGRHESQPAAEHPAAQSGFNERLSETSSVSHCSSTLPVAPHQCRARRHVTAPCHTVPPIAAPIMMISCRIMRQTSAHICSKSRSHNLCCVMKYAHALRCCFAVKRDPRFIGQWRPLLPPLQDQQGCGPALGVHWPKRHQGLTLCCQE